jgi:TetR/AcrR family transcriptional regulator
MRIQDEISSSPGRPAARLDRDARDRLVTAAAELFAELGVAATTFATIAKRAGLTPAMLHYYFKDREKLIDAVVDERLSGLIASVWEPVDPTSNPAEMILGIVDRSLEGIGRMPWVPSVWMREVLNDGGLLRSRVLRQLPIDKVRMVGLAIQRGQADGALNPELDPLLTVFSTLGLVMLHTATAGFWAKTFQRKPLTREALRRHITALLLNGLRQVDPRTRRKTRKKK